MSASFINVGRKRSGGVFAGLFGNPLHQKKVSERYRFYLRRVVENNPTEWQWLKDRLAAGDKLFCPGCALDCPTCHARIIEQEVRGSTCHVSEV